MNTPRKEEQTKRARQQPNPFLSLHDPRTVQSLVGQFVADAAGRVAFQRRPVVPRICPQCRLNPLQPGRQICSACRQANREDLRARRNAEQRGGRPPRGPLAHERLRDLYQAIPRLSTEQARIRLGMPTRSGMRAAYGRLVREGFLVLERAGASNAPAMYRRADATAAQLHAGALALAREANPVDLLREIAALTRPQPVVRKQSGVPSTRVRLSVAIDFLEHLDMVLKALDEKKAKEQE